MTPQSDLPLTAPQSRSFINGRRRLQFIESATRLIAERGIDGASFSAIAEDTKTSKSTIAYHFESRNQLLLSVVGAIYASAGEHMGAAPDGANSVERIRRYISSNLDWIASHRVEVLALVALRTGSVSEVRAFCNDIEQVVQNQLVDLLRAASKHQLAEDNHALIALALRGAIDTFSLALVREPTLSVRDYERTLMQLFEGDALA